MTLRVLGLDSAGQPAALHVGKVGPGDVGCLQESNPVVPAETPLECASSAARFALQLSTQPDAEQPAAALRVRVSAGGGQVLPAPDAARRVIADSDGGQSQVLLLAPEDPHKNRRVRGGFPDFFG